MDAVPLTRKVTFGGKLFGGKISTAEEEKGEKIKKKKKKVEQSQAIKGGHHISFSEIFALALIVVALSLMSVS